MLSDVAFWVYACWMLAICSIGLGVIGSSNQIALESGAAPGTAVAVVGLLSVCNGLGRLTGGVVFDRIGVAKTTAIIAFLHALGCGLLAVSILRGSVGTLVFAVVVAGLGIGASSAVGSGFVATVFGLRHYAENISLLNLVLIPAAFIGPRLLGNSVMDTGGYVAGLCVFVFLGVVAIALAGLLFVALRGSRCGKSGRSLRF